MIEDPRQRRRASTRGRIVSWLLLLVTVALASNLLIAARVLMARVDDRLDTELVHEQDKLSTFAGQARDEAGQPYRRVDQLLDAYLASTVPEDGEAYFSMVDGRPDRRSSNEPLDRLDRDAAFVTAIAGTAQPDIGVWESDAGEVRYGVFPIEVAVDERRGQLVVVEFAAPERAETTATVRVLAIVSVFALAAAGVVSWVVAGRLLRPIRTVSVTAEMISESDLTKRINVVGDDDVADLAQTFNRMLDRIETAFDGQRDFLHEAGHELRTPLTVVRGHLELMGDDPRERSATLPLVMDELGRMGRIIDDLLMLARAERPDFLAMAPVDVADLTVETLAKARHLGERRWAVDGVAEVVVIADGQRLTQALMQLMANAVDHTEAGGRICVGSAARMSRLVLWVQDDGRGIPTADQERIFERFGRIDTAGRRESTGLGLAIVRSIAEAHRGVVTVDSSPQRGATFTLDLPLRPVAEADAPDIPSSADSANTRGDADTEEHASEVARP